jgi:hypothetical protein
MKKTFLTYVKSFAKSRRKNSVNKEKVGMAARPQEEQGK